MMNEAVFPSNIAQYVDVVKIIDMPLTISLGAEKFDGQELFLRLTEEMREMWVSQYMPDIQEEFDEMLDRIRRIKKGGQVVLPGRKTLLDKDVDLFLRQTLGDEIDDFFDRIGPVVRGEDGARLILDSDKNLFIELSLREYISRFVIEIGLKLVDLDFDSISIHFALKFAESGSNFVSDFTEAKMDLDFVLKNVDPKCFDLCEYLGFNSWDFPKVVIDYHHIASTSWKKTLIYKNARELGSKFGKNIEYKLSFAIYQARYPNNRTKNPLRIPSDITSLTLSPKSAIKYNISTKALKDLESLSIRTDMSTLTRKRNPTTSNGLGNDNVFLGYSQVIPSGELFTERLYYTSSTSRYDNYKYVTEPTSLSSLSLALKKFESKSITELTIVVHLKEIEPDEDIEIGFATLFPELNVLKISITTVPSHLREPKESNIMFHLPKNLQKFYLLGEDMLFGKGMNSNITIISQKSLSEYDTFHYPHFIKVAFPSELMGSEKDSRRRMMSGLTIGVEPCTAFTSDDVTTIRDKFKEELVKTVENLTEIGSAVKLLKIGREFNLKSLATGLMPKFDSPPFSRITEMCKEIAKSSPRPITLRMVQGRSRGHFMSPNLKDLLKELDNNQLDLLLELNKADSLPQHLILHKVEVLTLRNLSSFPVKDGPIQMRGVRRLSIFGRVNRNIRWGSLNHGIRPSCWYVYQEGLQFPDLEMINFFPNYGSIYSDKVAEFLCDITSIAPNLKVIQLPFTTLIEHDGRGWGMNRAIVPSNHVLWAILEKFVTGLSTPIGEMEIRLVHPIIPKGDLRIAQDRFLMRKPKTMNSFPVENKCKLNITWRLIEDPFTLLD